MAVKLLIIVYLIAIGIMLLILPVKLLTSVQTVCPHCQNRTLYSRRTINFDCPHCNNPILRNGKFVLVRYQGFSPETH